MAKKKVVVSDVPDYRITITLGDKKLIGQGATAFDALKMIPKPDKIMAKGIVLVEHGNLHKTFLMPPVKLKRLFLSPHLQEIRVKQLTLGMKHATA